LARRPNYLLFVACLVAIALLVAVYAFFVGTPQGREIDATLAQRSFAPDSWWRIPVGLLSLPLLPPSILLALSGLLWLSRRAGHQKDGICAAVIVVLAAVGARALEALLQASDPLTAEATRALGPAFYPSGHAAVAMALCLGTLIVVRDPRPRLVLAGGVWCAVHGCVIFVTRAHHVSDVLGGFLLGVVLASVIGLRASSDVPIERHSGWTAVVAMPTAGLCAGLLFALARWVAASANQPRAVVVVTAAGLSIAAFLLVAAFSRLLSGRARLT
jgi:membrane-associated phospholipid phosphatase